jgi:hypothetical protein
VVLLACVLSWLWCRLHDLVGRLVQAPCTMAQFLMGAAALFAGVGGEFDAVDGEHLATDQALRIAGHQHLGKQWLDLLAKVAHELGDVCMAGLAVAADGDELHIALAGALDGTAGNQALAVGQQHHLEHDPRVVGTGTQPHRC